MLKIRRSSRIWLALVLVTMLSLIVTPSLLAVPGKAASKAPNNPHFEQFIASGQYSHLPSADDGHLLGYIPAPVLLPTLQTETDDGLSQSYSDLLAVSDSYFDLRTTGDVSPVRNQGSSGSCWAFATYGSMESSLLVDDETWDFSENNLKNTSGFDIGPNSGGNGYMSTAYLSRWSGPVNESDDPYVAASTSSPTGLPVQKHVQDVDFLPADIATIKQEIYDHGAVYTAFYYASSGFNDTYDSYYYGSTHSSNHAVTIVGWNDDYPASQFNTRPAGNGAWIVKNSWGTGWGANGYFYLSYYDKTALAENVAFHNAESTDNYGKEYSYDPLGWVGSYSYTWGANVFTASAGETLEAVSFYTPAPNSSYTVKIYTGVSSTPTSGSLATTQTGTIDFAGYHTVDLNLPPALPAGQKFSVVLSLNTSYAYPMAVEYPYTGYSSQATAASGQSYVGFNGTSWVDATSVKSKMNVCIKAFTSTGPTTPDLVISSLDAPVSAAPGEVTVNNTVKNQGTAAAGSFDVNLYLSTDQTLDGADTLLATRIVSGLAAGASSSSADTVVIASAGSYYVIAVADENNAIDESSETNNTAYDSIQIGQADLLITSANGTSTAYPGQQITINNTVANQGDLAAANIGVGFYLSTDAICDTGDVSLGFRTISSLADGSSNTDSTAVTLDSQTAPGSYYIIVVADPSDAVDESDETNNASDAYAITISEAPKPDLLISNLTAPDSAVTGTTISVVNAVANEGPGDAGSFVIQFYLSSDPDFDAADIALGSRTVSGLAAGATSSATTSLTIPASTTAGSYYILAMADPANSVVETDEGNNNSSTGPISITAAPAAMPDLIMTIVDGPTSGRIGRSISVSNTVRNQGTANSTSFVIKFYFSLDQILDPASDIYLGLRSVSSLAVNATSKATTSLKIPSNTSLIGKSYYIFAVADANAAVTESDETNNTRYDSVPVKISK